MNPRYANKYYQAVANMKKHRFGSRRHYKWYMAAHRAFMKAVRTKGMLIPGRC